MLSLSGRYASSNIMSAMAKCMICLCDMFDVLQTKETMTLRSNAFGSKPVISESLLKKVEGLVKEHILEFANLKQNKELAKTDGSKRSRIRGSCAVTNVQTRVLLSDCSTATKLAVAATRTLASAAIEWIPCSVQYVSFVPVSKLMYARQ